MPSKKKQIAQLQNSLDDLVKKHSRMRSRLQNSIKSFQWVKTEMEKKNKITGNKWKTYESAVQEIAKKYRNASDWGCGYTGVIIDVRSAMTTGSALEIKVNEDADEHTKEWMAEFVEANNLRGNYPAAVARQLELEGRVLLKIFYDKEYAWKTKPKEKGMVKARAITWINNKYTIEESTQDYMEYEKVKFSKDGVPDLSKKNFEYAKIGGFIDEPNYPVPKIWRVLTEVENLSRATADLRAIDHLFSAPTPDIEAETQADVETLQEQMPTNMALRKLFIHIGKFKYASPDMRGAQMLLEEAGISAQVIAGITGIPIHYLGFTDKMSNRSTADALVDSLNASTVAERITLESIWNRAIVKATELYKTEAKISQPDASKIQVQINIVTAEQWERIIKVFFPGVKEGKISLRTYLEQIPGVDPDAEIERIEEEALKRIEAYGFVDKAATDKPNIENEVDGTGDGSGDAIKTNQNGLNGKLE